MKWFLLIAGSSYYPQSGSDDWVDFFSSKEEAEKLISKKVEHIYFSKGPRKGEIKESVEKLYCDSREVDWYEIVDLKNFVSN